MMACMSSQRGSVFFYVLIAVVVFAALSYAIASSLRGNEAMGDQRIKLQASDIIDTGNHLADAVTRMRLRGAAGDSISFENPVVTGYTNPNCTSGSCKVFEHTGGGLSVGDAPPNSQATPAPWGYSGDVSISDVGTSAAELIAILPGVTVDVCRQIDTLLGIPLTSGNPPALLGLTNVNKFVGTYAGSPASVATAPFKSKKSGCFRSATASGTAIGTMPGGSWYYYQVLIAN